MKPDVAAQLLSSLFMLAVAVFMAWQAWSVRKERIAMERDLEELRRARERRERRGAAPMIEPDVIKELRR